MEHFLPHRPEHACSHGSRHQPLRVMKFGGTSVGDTDSIRKVVEIVWNSSAEGDLVVVVSAMSGVTNKLIEAAVQSEAGNSARAFGILRDLRRQHDQAVDALVRSEEARTDIIRKMHDLLDQCHRWCEQITQLGRLTPQMRDLISSLGERLSAPLVAAALAVRGVASEAIEATELVVTDSYHGAAEPNMDLTRERCEARLHPLLYLGVIPVVTGFIGATEDGALTTLGRGGSDYSATILGAALQANEVTIWTDVDGMLTADPHLVPDASTIPEISYREAAELAYFGAKVLHPKTLRPVMQCGIPVWIRNTFAPDKAGTRITPAGHESSGGVKALTAVTDAALIKVGSPAVGREADLVGRALATMAAVRTDVLMVAHSPSRNQPSRNQVCLVVAAAHAERTVAALRSEFAADAKHDGIDHVSLDATVSILTVVGEDRHVISGIIGRALDELTRANVDIIATALGSSEYNGSFVVAREHVKTALLTTHREFQSSILNQAQDSQPEARLP